MQSRRVHIFGGGSGIGRWLAEKLFSTARTTYCYDVSPRHLDLLPKSIHACPLDGIEIKGYADNFRSGDWIVLAVPQPALQPTLVELSVVLPPGVLVVVSTSTQRESLRLLKQHAPTSCDRLGFHPLFSHTVSGPVGQIAALTDFDESRQQHNEFMRAVASTGLLVTPLTADEHDRYMALIQSLTHFCLIGFAATVGASGVPPSALLKLKTPNFQFLYAFASRVLKLTTTTTGSIQFTPEARAVREALLSELNSLHNRLSSSNSVTECASVIDAARAPLTGAEIDEGAETSAVAVDALQRFEELLHTYKTSGRPFVFRHRITGLVHIVRIMEITHDEVRFVESTKRFHDADGNLVAVAIGLIDQTKANYRRVGISLPNPTKAEIRKRNIKLLTPNELKGFFREKVKPISRTINLLNPRDVKEDYVEELLPLAIRGLWKCEFLESFRRRGGVEKISVVVTANPSVDIDEVVDQVRLAVEEGKLTPRSRGRSS